MNYSFIPIKLVNTSSGIKKTPDYQKIEQAMGINKWGELKERKPTAEEKEIFMQASHQAIITGEANHLTVIDLDGTAEKDLLKQGYELPYTPTVRTQSGGKHLYFKYDSRMKTVAGINEQENIDCRNNGGYVVANGKGYEWLISFKDAELKEVPNIFLDMMQIKHTKPSQRVKKQLNSKVAESISDAYKQARNVNMADFLIYHGYNVSEHEKFSCIFDEHADIHPSASIYTTDSNEHRYICFTHPESDMSLTLIDLWARLKGIEVHEAVTEILAFVGIDYKEGEFIKMQKEKYHYNTMKINDLEEIGEHFPNLYGYLNRYELEYRALADHAEANLHGTQFSYNNDAIFYMSSRYAGEKIARYKHTATVNTKRANDLLNILCLLGIIERIPSDKVTDHAKSKTKNLNRNGNEIAFYSFNWLTDGRLSQVEYIARKMKEKSFKVSTMTKDVVISMFGHDIAERVYPDGRTQSNQYMEYITAYAKIIMEQINTKGYTTKKEAVSLLNANVSRRTKEYNFDKVINEICNSYDLKYSFTSKEKKQQLNVSSNEKSKILYQAS